MYIEKIFSNQEDNENLYSVILDEEELSLFNEFEERVFSKKDGDDDLNLTDTLSIASKKYLTPKFANDWNKDQLETDDKEKRHKTAKRTAAIMGASGAAVGALSGKMAGSNKAAAVGAAMGGAVYGAGGYVSSRIGSKLANKIRKSGGGGSYDDSFIREKDRIDVAQGKMSKSDFKKKWYRNGK